MALSGPVRSNDWLGAMNVLHEQLTRLDLEHPIPRTPVLNYTRVLAVPSYHFSNVPKFLISVWSGIGRLKNLKMPSLHGRQQSMVNVIKAHLVFGTQRRIRCTPAHLKCLTWIAK